MKYLNLLLAVCIAIPLAGCSDRTSVQQTEQITIMEKETAIEIIHRRTSIRSFTGDMVPDEVIETLLRAGMAAPSATNAQPWQFLVVDDRKLLDEIGTRLQTSKMVSDAPVAILVCGDMAKARSGWLREYWIQDCSAASQNILLAATELGLGAVWTSIYPAEDRIETISKILSLPDHIVPLNVIPIGWPGEEKDPADKWDASRIRYNRWTE